MVTVEVNANSILALVGSHPIRIGGGHDQDGGFTDLVNQIGITGEGQVAQQLQSHLPASLLGAVLAADHEHAHTISDRLVCRWRRVAQLDQMEWTVLM